MNKRGCGAITEGVCEFKAKIPVMVNNKTIYADDEIVLFSEIKPKAEPKAKAEDWASQLLQACKRQKT